MPDLELDIKMILFGGSQGPSNRAEPPLPPNVPVCRS
jgi:hypothetical protein